MKKWEVVGAAVALIVALGAWLLPFQPVGQSPLSDAEYPSRRPTENESTTASTSTEVQWVYRRHLSRLDACIGKLGEINKEFVSFVSYSEQFPEEDGTSARAIELKSSLESHFSAFQAICASGMQVRSLKEALPPDSPERKRMSTCSASFAKEFEDWERERKDAGESIKEVQVQLLKLESLLVQARDCIKFAMQGE